MAAAAAAADLPLSPAQRAGHAARRTRALEEEQAQAEDEAQVVSGPGQGGRVGAGAGATDMAPGTDVSGANSPEKEAGSAEVVSIGSREQVDVSDEDMAESGEQIKEDDDEVYLDDEEEDSDSDDAGALDDGSDEDYDEKQDRMQRREAFQKNEVAHMTMTERVQKLNELLDKTSMYSNFLAKQLGLDDAVDHELISKLEKVAGADAVDANRKRVADGSDEAGPSQKRSRSVGVADDAEAAPAGGAPPPLPSQARRPSFAQPKLVGDPAQGLVLRDYQLEGVQWLASLFENGLHGILADEMGLGKTIQVLSLFAHLYEHGIHGPFLVVGPLSTVHNWFAEARKWVPSLDAVLYHGTPDARREIREEKFSKKKYPAIIVTSYEIVMRDRVYMQNYPWKYIVVDEGHRIKNLNCRLVTELKKYKSANRLLLTGTPLQNTLLELWSLLNFCCPEIFDDVEAFHQWFDFSEDLQEMSGSRSIMQKRAKKSTGKRGRPKKDATSPADDVNAEEDSAASAASAASARKRLLSAQQENQTISKLHKILKPFLLRRVKTDVILDLPKKYERTFHAPMTTDQQELYTAIYEKQLKEYLEDQYPWSLEMMRQLGYSSQNMLMQLRKACAHPFLFHWPIDKAAQENYRLRGIKPTPSDEVMDERLVTASGKMTLLDRMLPRLREEGHKVLIFTNFTMMLDILEDYCELRQFSYRRLDGSDGLDERRNMMAEFNVETESRHNASAAAGIPMNEAHNPFVFMLSTRAGGLGINLVAADTVIFYDNDWNPMVDLQAQDRAHRIGQTRAVRIFKFVTKGTVEQGMMLRAQDKKTLDQLVIQEGNFKGIEHNSLLTSTKDIERVLEASKPDFGRNSEAVSDKALFDWGEGFNNDEHDGVQ